MTITAKELVKKYDNRRVVNKVNLRVNKGEIVGLLGPNGAGKTTTFYMIVGLIKPDHGNVHLDEEDLTHQPMYQRAKKGIGYLSQEPSVFRKMSVYNNIKAVLELRDLTDEEMKSRIEELLDEFHLNKIRDSYGYQLSGGERRRVEIARSLAIEPSFILLDEPFTGIDPIAVSEIQKIIMYLKEKGLGVLITDHSVRETLSITDRAYIMYEGDILMSGNSEEIAESELAREFYLGDEFQI
ncbi:MAG TPA: LPS export ABC transporter ATP-binding protein [Halanaerobiales bacterium]|nr:LPS export ABC transporter ATP-binding protein [Halanaerobiales bacterium]